MTTPLTLYGTVGRKLRPEEVDANFTGLRSNVDKLGGRSEAMTPTPGTIVTRNTDGGASLMGALDVLMSTGTQRVRVGYDLSACLDIYRLQTAAEIHYNATQANASHVFEISGVEKVRIDYSGNLLAGGAVASSTWQRFLGVGGVAYPGFVWQSTGGAKFSIGIDGTFLAVRDEINAAYRLTIDASGHILAGADNAQTLGGAAKRWSVVYAGTGTINTSDARDKTPVRTLTAVEIAAASDLAREVGVFQFLDAVALKGPDEARLHIGPTVQRAMEIMQSHGLDPLRYAFICYDEWEDQFVNRPEEVNEEGVVIREAWTEQVQVAGNRYGFRYNELAMFILRGQEARLTALEGR